MTKKRNWQAPWSATNLPVWIRNMKEITELQAESSDGNARSISLNKRTFDKTAVTFEKIVGKALPTSGLKFGGHITTPGRGTALPIVPGQVTQPPPSEHGRLCDSGGGGNFGQPPNRNGCYLLQSLNTKHDLALCPEACSQYCGHHAAVHRICSSKECKKDHKW